MKILKALMIVDKADPKIKLINLVDIRDRRDIRITKDEEIEEVVVMTVKDYLKLIVDNY